MDYKWLFLVWIVMLVWGWSVVSRAGIEDPAARLLWFAVILGVPIVGPLTAFGRFRLMKSN